MGPSGTACIRMENCMITAGLPVAREGTALCALPLIKLTMLVRSAHRACAQHVPMGLAALAEWPNQLCPQHGHQQENQVPVAECRGDAGMQHPGPGMVAWHEDRRRPASDCSGSSPLMHVRHLYGRATTYSAVSGTPRPRPSPGNLPNALISTSLCPSAIYT